MFVITFDNRHTFAYFTGKKWSSKFPDAKKYSDRAEAELIAHSMNNEFKCQDHAVEEC